jgi:hypothetical protein
MNLYGLDEKDHQEAQDDEQGGLAVIAYPVIAYPVIAIFATWCCWQLVPVLAALMEAAK